MKFRHAYIPILLSVTISSPAGAAPGPACPAAITIPAPACTSSPPAAGNRPVIRLLQGHSPVAPILVQSLAPGRGRLGVQIQEVTGEIASSLGMRRARGALVSLLYGYGTAKSGGIKVGDVIVEFDGHEIKGVNDLPSLVSNTPVGKDVQVVVIRAGHEETMTVKVGTEVEGLHSVVAAGTCLRMGFGLGYDNFDAASAAALEDCAKEGDRSCKPILAIHGNCGSVAVDGVYVNGVATCHARGWANGSEKRLAEEGALAACAKAGGRKCEVATSICNAD
jgi:hypothetical protein